MCKDKASQPAVGYLSRCSLWEADFLTEEKWKNISGFITNIMTSSFILLFPPACVLGIWMEFSEPCGWCGVRSYCSF